jgi:hypothetical protein
VGAFPDGQSALNLAATRRRHIADTAWSTKRYLPKGGSLRQHRQQIAPRRMTIGSTDDADGTFRELDIIDEIGFVLPKSSSLQL